MKRKIYKQLLKWKESKDRKPLMLLGARQVGKTWIMQHFGKKKYKNVAYINCDDEPRMKQLFDLLLLSSSWMKYRRFREDSIV